MNSSAFFCHMQKALTGKEASLSACDVIVFFFSSLTMTTARARLEEAPGLSRRCQASRHGRVLPLFNCDDVSCRNLRALSIVCPFDFSVELALLSASISFTGLVHVSRE